MSETPYIGFGNDTLNQQPKVNVGDLIICPNCEEEHPLEPPDSGGDTIYFYRCKDKVFLGAVKGRATVNLKPDVSGSI